MTIDPGWVAYLDQRQAYNEKQLDEFVAMVDDYLTDHNNDVALVTAHIEHQFNQSTYTQLAGLVALLSVRLARLSRKEPTA